MQHLEKSLGRQRHEYDPGVHQWFVLLAIRLAEIQEKLRFGECQLEMIRRMSFYRQSSPALPYQSGTLHGSLSARRQPDWWGSMYLVFVT